MPSALTQGKSIRYELPGTNFHLGETPPREPQGGGEHTEFAVSILGQLNGMRSTRRYYSETRRAHEVALAELDAAMAQDVVGRGAVEIEVRQRVVEQQRLPRELALGAAREGDLDLLVLAAVDLRRLQALDELDGLGDALLQLGDGRLRFGKGRQLDAGEPAAGVEA